MSRKYGQLLLCVVVALMVLAMFQPAPAQVIFFADFEDALGVNNPALWVPDNAGQAWGVADFPGSGQGLKQLNEGCGNSGNTPLPGVTDFTDGIIQLDMSWEDDDSWGVIFRKSADDAGYIVFFGYIETPYVIIGDLANGCAPTGSCLSDTPCEGGGGEIIQVSHNLGANLTMDLSVSYTGRVEVKGDTIRVWYLPTADIPDPLGDLGDPLVEIHDSAHAGPGSVGIWQESQGGSMIDNVLVMGFSSERASSPNPENGAVDVPRDVVLSWVPGEFAATHDVYFGTVFEDVNAASRADPRGVLVSQGQSAQTYDAGRLDLGQTYYWRVDEVNAPPDSTIFKGDVWSFIVEPVAYPIGSVIATSNGVSDASAGPENTINGSGLDAADQHSTNASDMWLATPGADPLWIQYEFNRVYKLHQMFVWNYNVQFELLLGYGLRDVTVEYSENGADWTVMGDVELNQATAKSAYAANTSVDFGGIAAKYVRLNVNSGWGMFEQFGLSEVRFTYIPVQAREPEPADGAADVDPAVELSWRAGREAASHDVYLGTDPETLSLVDSPSGPTSTADLEFGMTYYWKVDEIGDEIWAGDVWNFSTLEYALIDGFEAYNDDVDAGTTIFDTWLDGWVNDNGATVGYFDAPFAEKTIVHSGGQSMPLAYDNTASPFYSEAERVFDPAQNWSVNGADALVLHFQGVPGPFVELASGKIIMGAAGADIWNAADEFRFVYKPLNGNGSIVAYVESVANTDPWAKGGVMIRETLDAGSTFAAVYSTPGNGCRYQARLTADVAAVSDSGVATPEQIALLAPHWVKIERVGNTFNGYYSTDGQNWTSMSWNPQTIAMASNVYIGLALTSHAAGVLAK